jgi:tetratricopeptide (TPR) repeat protein/predicted Ser/Thr protein kinase
MSTDDNQRFDGGPEDRGLEDAEAFDEDEDDDDDGFGLVMQQGLVQREGLEEQALFMEMRKKVLGAESEPLLVGRYRILRKIGSGGMGVVYEAYDPDLERLVALKVVRASAIGTTASDLMREARAIARLADPHVVAVHEAGTVGEETFVAMELVHGGDLSDWQREKHSWREVVALYRQAGEGLAAAHRAGLVHGDFKPKNVLIGTDQRARVADFGLARSQIRRPVAEDVSPSLAKASSLDRTIAGPLGGTPLYMAPELHFGAKPSEKSDQFAYAVALFEAIYGQHPFGSGFAAIENIKRGALQPLPAAVKVPKWLRQLILRGLASKADERWSSMDALLLELGRDRDKIRHRWLLASVSLGVVAATFGAVHLQQVRRAAVCAQMEQELASAWTPELHQSVKRAILGANESFGQTVWAQVDKSLTDYAKRWTAMRTGICETVLDQGEASQLALRRIQCLEEHRNELQGVVSVLATPGPDVAVRALEVTSGLLPLSDCESNRMLRDDVLPLTDSVLAGQVAHLRQQVAQATALHRLGSFAAAIDIARSVMDAAEHLKYPPLRAEVLFRLGTLLADSGIDPEKGMEFLEESAWVATAHSHDRVVALAATEMMIRLNFGGKFDEVKRWRAFANAAVERVGRGGIEEAFFHNDLAMVLDYSGDYEGSQRELEASIALKARLWGDDHVEVVKSINNLAVVYEEAGDFDRSLSEHDRVIALNLRNLGATHPFQGISLGNRGMVYALNRRYEEAEVDIDAALKLLAEQLGEEHAWYGAIFVGRCRVEAGRHDTSAIATCERAVQMTLAGFGPTSQMVAESLTMLARAQLGQGALDAAWSSAQRALAINNDAPLRNGKADETKFVAAQALLQIARRDGDPELLAKGQELAKKAHEGFNLAGPGWKASGLEAQKLLESHTL